MASESLAHVFAMAATMGFIVRLVPVDTIPHHCAGDHDQADPPSGSVPSRMVSPIYVKLFRSSLAQLLLE